MALAKTPLLLSLRDACRTAQGSSDSGSQPHRVIEDAFLRAAVAFEGFVSEWLPRCLHRDLSHLKSEATRVAQREAARFGADWMSAPGVNSVIARVLSANAQLSVSVLLDDRCTLAVARSFLDVEDRTLSIRSMSDLKALAGRTLGRRYQQRLSNVSRGDCAVVNATIALRNALAHRSPSSARQASELLRHGDMPASLAVSQNVTVATIGRYLGAGPADRPRYCQYFESLAKVSHTLAPTRGAPLKICAEA